MLLACPWRRRWWWILVVWWLAMLYPVHGHVALEKENDKDPPVSSSSSSSSRWKPLFLRRPAAVASSRGRNPKSSRQADIIPTAASIGNALRDNAHQFQIEASYMMQSMIPPDPPVLLQEFQEILDNMELQVQGMQHEFQQQLLRNVFHQRLGWERVRHSIRNHLLFFLGAWVTFQGQTHPWLAHYHHPHHDQLCFQGHQTEDTEERQGGGGGGSLTLHVAQVSWYIMDATFDLMYTPWSQDLASLFLAYLFYHHCFLCAKNSSSRSVLLLLVQAMPHVLLGITILPLWSLILQAWYAQEHQGASQVSSPVVAWSCAAAIGLGGLKLLQIPVPLAASSLSGALLLYDSMRAEIAGNYIHMMKLFINLILRPLVRLLRWLIRRIWHPAWFLLKGWFRGTLQNLLHPPSNNKKDFVGHVISALQKLVFMIRHVWKTLTVPIHKAQQAMARLPLVQSANRVANRLRRALEPVMIPLALSMWGIAVQKQYITNLSGMWNMLQLSVDPVSFARNRLKAFVNPQSQTMQAILGMVRSIRQWRSFRQREVPTTQ